MARGDAAESAAAGGIGVNGSAAENAGVTVSTLALTERLAKLSAGRVLLDRVRADTRSLASVVTSQRVSRGGGGRRRRRRPRVGSGGDGGSKLSCY
ncbi:unnamed protein product [Ectocarpus sp. 12 AP-2014]